MNHATIQENTIDRRNNFDFMRLVFALFVIISHSYDLSGNHHSDWLCVLVDHQTNLATLGVKGFFIISGYLIFQSLHRSKGLLDYYWKRVLRLFPGLFVVLLLTVLLAPFVYLNDTNYWMNKSVWTYIPNNMMLYKLQLGIDGIFETNPFKGVINGSLWTIPYEFTLYILLSAFIVIIKKPVLVKIVACAISGFLLIGNIFYLKENDMYWYNISYNNLLNLSSYFYSGALLAIIKINFFSYKKSLLLLSVLLIIISLALNIFSYSSFILLPLTIILAGISSTPILNSISDRIGDLSYGLYIYAFPIQQTLIYYFAPTEIQLMLLTMGIAFILAYFSWHFIESKALRLKNISFKTLFLKKI